MQTEFLMNFSLRRKQHEEPCKRSGHVAVQYNGCMLVWGGYTDERDIRESHTARMEDRYMSGDEVWCLDIEAQKWQKWTSKRNSPAGMSGSCASCVGNMMYIIGGHTIHGNSNQLHRFDIRKKQWTTLTPKGMAPSSRDKFICWPYEDKIVIFGGFGPPPDDEKEVKGEWIADPSSVRYYDHGVEIRGWNNHVYVYDIRTNTWSQPNIEGDPPCPRAAHAGCVVGQRGYVFGGRFGDLRRDDIHYLDLGNMRWSGLLDVNDDVPVGRSWHGLATCSDRHVMLYGGFSTDRVALGDTWVFDTVCERWTQQAIEDKPRLWHTFVSSHSPGEVVAFGGCTNNILDPEQFDIQTNAVVNLFFSPKSLSRLCTESIVHYKDILGQQIGMLPKSLIERVEDFMQGMLPDTPHTHRYNLRSRHDEEQRDEAMDER